jgi:Zn-dependent protease with chaperone function
LGATADNRAVTGRELLRHRLANISPKAYEHPADRAATAALKSIPKLDVVVRRLIEFQYERALRQTLLASSLKLGPDQLPDIWEDYERVLATLDMPTTYDLYVTQWPVVNAATIGSGKPMIVLNSATVSLLDRRELETVIAHEVGHVLSDHVMYRTALLLLLQLGTGRLPLAAGLPLLAIRAALLEWFRAAELSCDRAATLVNRDPLVTCRTMMVVASGMSSRTLNLDAFLKQAAEYEEWESGWDRMTRLLVELGLTHDFPVRRVHELTKWVRSGEYDRIISGDFLKRDEDFDPRVAANEAADHYARRFRRIFSEAQEEVEKASGRLSDWLRYGPQGAES